MNRRALAVLAVASGAAVVGLFLAFAPDTVAIVSLPSLLSTLLAGFAVAAGCYRAWLWFRDDDADRTVPAPERGRPVSVPGDDFDSLLSSTPSVGTSSGDRRALKVRDDLEDAAIAVLTRHRGLSEAAARARLDDGTWTDDPLAAEFFTSVSGSGSSLRESVAGSFWGDGPFQRRASHVAAELDRIAGHRGDG